MNDSHEKYLNAPLALVAVEVRFPGGAPTRQFLIPQQRAFRDLLGDNWVIESARIQQLAFSIGPTGPAPPTFNPITIPRFTVRDRSLAVAITDNRAS